MTVKSSSFTNLHELGIMHAENATPRALPAVLESPKGVLHKGSLEVWVQYMIEVMFAIWKDKFADSPAVQKELDLMDEKETITHHISIEDDLKS